MLTYQAQSATDLETPSNPRVAPQAHEAGRWQAQDSGVRLEGSGR